MLNSRIIVSRLSPILRRSAQPLLHRYAGVAFSTKAPCMIDGVYSELTAMRTQIPFVEALRKKQAQEASEAADSSTPSETTQSQPRPKTMSESFHRVLLPLAKDPWLLDSYINSSGHIRLGTIFMDLDALAGVVAYKHAGDSVMTVTAAVDRIALRRPLSEICDLELSGQVTFATGRSSMEISLQVAKAPADGQTIEDDDILMTCTFTMVSLDKKTKRPVALSPLKIEDEREQRLFDRGKQNHALKKERAKTTLRKQTPNDEESDLIHALWLQQLDYHDPSTSSRKPDNAMYMDASKIQTVQIMQPQYRNRANFMIFGGFLLKSTFELAFTCASAISHSRPTFVALDPSTFENPVPVGSVLYLTAQVAYTDSPVVTMGDVKASPEGSSFIQVRVDSKVRSVEHESGETKPTGQFNFTFEVKKDLKIIPQTYSQFMVYLDARRRVQQTIKSLEPYIAIRSTKAKTVNVME